MKAKFNEITFTDADVVNPDDFIPAGEFNPHNIHPILIHDHGFPVALVFASNLQEALDIAVDNNKLDSFQIAEEYWETCPNCAFLGNASEPFDIETLAAIDLPNPKFSFVALFNARQESEEEN